MSVFGNWSIDSQLFEWIKENVKSSDTFVEIGSGHSTSELKKLCNIWSIEENAQWVNVYHNQYIHAPIVNEWYDLEIIKNNLPDSINVILVDGPAHGERIGFFNNIELFLEKQPSLIIFDDIERPKDYECYLAVLDYLKQKNYELETQVFRYSKSFSYIKILNKK